jgi:hypothetical protein
MDACATIWWSPTFEKSTSQAKRSTKTHEELVEFVFISCDFVDRFGQAEARSQIRICHSYNIYLD